MVARSFLFPFGETMNIAVVFPGQGSQRVGMGADLAATFPGCKRLFEEASDALGYDMLALCSQGPEDRLRLTEFTQPAILTVSVAAYFAWRERSAQTPVCAAGHSLGEYSALVAAGMLTFSDAVRLVRTRGRAMQDAVPVGQGQMAAVLGLSAEAVAEVCGEAAQGEVVAPANQNAPGQVVISGHIRAVERAAVLAKARGAKRVLPLDVSAPFHCSLMAPAAKELGNALEGVTFSASRFPVLANVDAQAYPPGNQEARKRLIDQVCAPVLWEDCVHRIEAYGATHSLECGPGKVVSALIKRIAPRISLMNVETVSDLSLPVAT
jgi:[acyl-carrier-protein] S-malonyltransferase